MGGKGFNCKTNTRLVYNEKTTRMNCTNILLSLETGKHLDLEWVRYHVLQHYEMSADFERLFI